MTKICSRWLEKTKGSARSAGVALAFMIILGSPFVFGQSGQLPPNDDGSSSPITISFPFRFYGVDYTTLWVNNNGNITFGGPLSTFTPFAFPSSGGNPMIAPFFADVDTRDGHGTVSYTGTPDFFKVVWSNVGYYNATDDGNTNARNTFSVTLQRNNGITFEYVSMNWTTGDASEGAAGFGGVPATLGIDKGNGVDAIAFRRYSGPNVGELNGTSWYFQTDQAILEVPLFKQFQAPWGNTTTINGSSTMTNTGCFVTSTSMLLKTFGHNTDPGKFNTFLKNSVAPYSMPGGLLDFTRINPNSLFYGQTDNVPGPKKRFRSAGYILIPTAPPLPPEGDLGMRNQITNQLRAAIDLYGPVVLRVPSRNWGMNGYADGTHTHAIVAYQVTDSGSVLIREPGWNASPGNLDDYVDFVNNHVSTVRNQPNWRLTNANGTFGGHDFSWLGSKLFTFAETLTPFSKQIIQGEVNSPVEIVITDHLGRRLGRNPVTGQTFREIPESSYFREMDSAPAETTGSLPLAGHTPLIFEVGAFSAGNYRVDVYGTGNGPWSINFGVSDPILGLNPGQYTRSGTATTGSTETFTLAVAGPTPGITPSPTPTPPASPSPTPIPVGIEGDVVDANGGPNGDGQILANDVGVLRQFVLGTSIPASPDQFRRADINGGCGDNAINAADVTVIRLFVLGALNPPPACDPVAGNGVNRSRIGSEGIARTLRGINTLAIPGQHVSVPIHLDSFGNETSLSFSVKYDSESLSFVNVLPGSGLPENAEISLNELNSGSGEIGILVDALKPFGIGRGQVLLLNFRVSEQTREGEYPVTLSSSPTEPIVATLRGDVAPLRLAESIIKVINRRFRFPPNSVIREG